MDVNERVQTQPREPQICRLDGAPRKLALLGIAGAKWKDHPHLQDRSGILVLGASARLPKVSVCILVMNVARYACFSPIIPLGSIRCSETIRDWLEIFGDMREDGLNSD